MGSSKRLLIGLCGAAALSCSAAGAQAQGVEYGYRHAYSGYGSGYGFAEPAIRGEYIGAPFTRTPRPSDLVPSVWGYGTYGVPTMTGIRTATVGVPTVYVIEAPARAVRQKGPRIVSRDGRWSQAETQGEPRPASAGGARVIAVSVPRR